MAAALSIGRSLHSRNKAIQGPKTRSSPRILVVVSCQTGEPLDTSGSKAKKQTKRDTQQVRQLFGVVEKFGKEFKDNLRPKHKGDWKDAALMAVSFAVYIYISQQIVCAYCAWMSMFKHSW